MYLYSAIGLIIILLALLVIQVLIFQDKIQILQYSIKKLKLLSIFVTIWSLIYAIIGFFTQSIIRYTIFQESSNFVRLDRSNGYSDLINLNLLFTYVFLIPFIFWIITYFIKKSNELKKNTEITLNSEFENNNKPNKNKYAIIGIVLSIIAMFTGFGLFGYFGMTSGIIARIKINDTKEDGKKLANTAIVIGYIYGVFMSFVHFFQAKH